MAPPREDWTPLCAEAAIGGVAALAAAAAGELIKNPGLRRLLETVAAEAGAAARRAGALLRGRPEKLAARLCRRSPRRLHPWLRALRAGRATEAGRVFDPLLEAARRAGAPCERLEVIAAAIRRLEASA